MIKDQVACLGFGKKIRENLKKRNFFQLTDNSYCALNANRLRMKRALWFCLIVTLVPFTLSLPTQVEGDEQTGSSEEVLVTSPPALEDNKVGYTTTERYELSTELNDNEKVKDLDASKSFNNRWKQVSKPMKPSRINRINSRKDNRKKWRRRRPSNSKKGANKGKPKIPVELVQLSDIKETNNAVDGWLSFVSQHVKDEPPYGLRLGSMSYHIVKKPWGFVMPGSNKKNEDPTIRFKRESGKNNSTDSLYYDEEEEDTKSEDDANDENEESSALINPNTDDIDQHTPEKDVSDDQTQSETSTTEDGDSETDDGDDDDDDDENGGVDLTENIKSDNSSSRPLNSTLRVSSIPVSVIQQDGTKIFNVKLLDEKEESTENMQEFHTSTVKSVDDDRTPRKDGKLTRSKHRGQRRSRRPKVYVNGSGSMKRSGDVVVFTKSGTETYTFDIPLDFESMYFTLDENLAAPVNVSRISSLALKARLRLKERDGIITSVRLKPFKMSPSDVIVSLNANEEEVVADQTAQLLTYFSQEIAQGWNSGLILRPVKRQFKRFILADKYEAKYGREQPEKVAAENKMLLAKILQTVVLTPVSTTPRAPDSTLRPDQVS